MKKVIILLFLILPFSFASAETITYEGCAALSVIDTDITVRMLAMEANISISDVGQKTYNFTVKNLDPDYVLVENYDAGTLIRSSSSLTFQATVNNDLNISIVPWYDPIDNFYFAAIGDNQGEESVSGEFTEFMGDINIINPYFSLNAGDLVSGNGAGTSPDGELEPMFESFSTAIDSFNQPHFTVPGNHDHGDNDFAMYETYLGDYNSNFDFANTHFSLVSSVNNSGAQGYMLDNNYNWLNNDLESTSLQKVVMFHHPIELPDWAVSGFSNETNRQNVLNLLEQNNINTLITGHSHGYDYSFIDNNFYQLVTGGAGADLTQPDGYHHFVLLHVYQDEITPQVVKEGEFYLEREELNNNDGTEDSVTTRIYNDGSSDWPWLRLKYKLNEDIEYLYAFDQEGNYYSFQDQLLDDYRVAYLETDIIAYGYKDITVAKSTKIHQGITNTINSKGEVIYSEQPINNTTETSLTAVPSVNSINLEISAWEDTNKTWQIENIADSQTINFTISSLNQSNRYYLKVNDKLYNYYNPDDNSEILFSYASAGQEMTFELIKENHWYAENIVLAPAADGGPHIRTFNTAGELQAQFYAYDSSLQAGFNAISLDVDGDQDGEIAVVAEGGVNKKLKLFDDQGNLLGKHRIFKSYYDGYNIKTGDLDADGDDEIIIAPQRNKRKIKIFDYENNSLDLLTSKEIYKNFTGGINIETADINGDNIAEIIVAPYTQQNSIKIYQLQNNKLKKLAEKEIFIAASGYSGINITAGDINKNIKKELIFSPKNSNKNILKIYRYSDNKLVYKLKKNIHSNENIISGNVGGQKDKILITDGNSVQAYYYKSNKLYKMQTMYPYEEDYFNGINFNFVGAQLVIAPASDSQKIKIYSYQSSQFENTGSFWGYDPDFTGGVNL